MRVITAINGRCRVAGGPARRALVRHEPDLDLQGLGDAVGGRLLSGSRGQQSDNNLLSKRPSTAGNCANAPRESAVLA
jgi:hypothetical protein